MKPKTKPLPTHLGDPAVSNEQWQKSFEYLKGIVKRNKYIASIRVRRMNMRGTGQAFAILAVDMNIRAKECKKIRNISGLVCTLTGLPWCEDGAIYAASGTQIKERLEFVTGLKLEFNELL